MEAIYDRVERMLALLFNLLAMFIELPFTPDPGAADKKGTCAGSDMMQESRTKRKTHSSIDSWNCYGR